jgi:hypothetical protein
MEAYSGRKTKIDSIPMHAWGKIKAPYKSLIKYLIGSSFDVFILGRQKNVFETDSVTEEMTKAGVAMRAEGETAYEPHICMRLESKIDPMDTTTSQYLAYIEKDRTGVLSGKTLKNISFATIEPLLPLLGAEQAKPEDEDERIFKDSELLASNEDKAKAKEAKSAELMRSFQAKLITATSLDACKEISAEVAKSKRYLTEEHFNSVVDLGKSKREELSK